MRKYLHSLNLFLLCFLSLNAADISNSATHWDGSSYAENGQLQQQWAQKFFFDRYKLSGFESVLDIGCGDGRLTQAIAFQAPCGKVIAIDNSESMISYAKKQFGLSPNLVFEVVDAMDLSFYEAHAEIFDIIVSFHCLHWVSDQQAVLDGIKVALKLDGKAFLRLTSKGFDPIQEIADSLIKSEKWSSYFIDFQDPIHRYSKEEYAALVQQSGLEILRIEEVLENDCLPSTEALAKQIKSWLPHLKHLPKDLQDVFLEEIVSQYLQQVPIEDGKISLYDCYLEIELKKISERYLS